MNGEYYTCATCSQFKDCQSAFGEPGQVGIGCADWERRAPDFYMNVWRDASGDHQWTDVNATHDETNTREFSDRVAESIASRPNNGIRRLGILRVTLKRQQSEGGVA